MTDEAPKAGTKTKYVKVEILRKYCPEGGIWETDAVDIGGTVEIPEAEARKIIRAGIATMPE